MCTQTRLPFYPRISQSVKKHQSRLIIALAANLLVISLGSASLTDPDLDIDFDDADLVGCADSKYTQRRWLDKLTVCQKKLYSV